MQLCQASWTFDLNVDCMELMLKMGGFPQAWFGMSASWMVLVVFPRLNEPPQLPSSPISSCRKDCQSRLPPLLNTDKKKTFPTNTFPVTDPTKNTHKQAQNTVNYKRTVLVRLNTLRPFAQLYTLPICPLAVPLGPTQLQSGQLPPLHCQTISVLWRAQMDSLTHTQSLKTSSGGVPLKPFRMRVVSPSSFPSIHSSSLISQISLVSSLLVLISCLLFLWFPVLPLRFYLHHPSLRFFFSF